jgi:hypothetical protein
MESISIGMAREADPRDVMDHHLRPRPLHFPVQTEDLDRVRAASQDELDQFARNMIANCLIAQPVRIDANPPGNYRVENVRFNP